MKECLIGIAMGVVVGALLVQSCPKAQETVDKTANFVKKKLDKITKK